MNSKLISRNVTVNGHRTSIRLEHASWAGFDDICKIEGLTGHELCTLIEARCGNNSRTSSVRAFIVTYFRLAAAEAGYKNTSQTSAVFSFLDANAA